jgi:hypothetical protein
MSGIIGAKLEIKRYFLKSAFTIINFHFFFTGVGDSEASYFFYII